MKIRPSFPEGSTHSVPTSCTPQKRWRTKKSSGDWGKTTRENSGCLCEKSSLYKILFSIILCPTSGFTLQPASLHCFGFECTLSLVVLSIVIRCILWTRAFFMYNFFIEVSVWYVRIPIIFSFIYTNVVHLIFVQREIFIEVYFTNKSCNLVPDFFCFNSSQRQS